MPASIRESYDEAYAVLADSPKASAALSRRCLQEILQTAAQTRAHDLADAIDEVLASKTLPSHLALDIDQVRVVGNFAAHPIKSKTSGQIVSVEPHEAEFNLHVVHALLDFYYAAPAAAAARRAAITAKITAAGKTLKAPPP